MFSGRQVPRSRLNVWRWHAWSDRERRWLFSTRLPRPSGLPPVLSCLGIRAQGELDALRRAIRQAGCDNVELLVVTSEEQMVLQIRSVLAAGKCPEVTRVESMPDDLDGLRRMISGFGPHILHFFCHGSVEGSPHIAIATTNDWRDKQGISSITAEANEFGGFTRRTDDLPWLIVLNCCEGAGVKGAGNSQSLALSLVLNGTSAAAKGMREPVQRSTANKLTEAQYGKVLSDLAARIEAPADSPQPLDWPLSPPSSARDRLATVYGKPRSATAACRKEWTMPVILCSPKKFHASGLADPPHTPETSSSRSTAPIWRARSEFDHRTARVEITVLNAMLADQPPDQADEFKDDAITRV